MVELALILQVVVFASLLAVFLLSGQASVFHPLTFYFLFHLISFVLRPYAIYIFDLNRVSLSIGYFPEPIDFVRTCTATSLALLIVIFTAISFGRAKVIPMPAVLRFKHEQDRAFWITTVLLSPLALYSMYLSLGGFGWQGFTPVQVVRDIEHGTFIYSNTTGYFTLSHTLFGYLAILFIVKNRFRLVSFAPLGSYLVYRGILGHGRWFIVVSMFTVMLLWLYDRRRLTFRPLHYVTGAFCLLAFTILGRDRSAIRGFFGLADLAAPGAPREQLSWLEWLDNLDFSAFDVVAAISRIVPGETHSYSYFTQYLQLLTQPIPRILWENKPVGSPVSMFNLMDHGNFWRLPPSIVGDAWMNLGWVGIIITSAGVGFALGRFHRWFWQHREDPFVVISYCCLLPVTIQWFRDGGISVVVFGFFILLPIVAWMGVCKVCASGRTSGRQQVSKKERVKRLSDFGVAETVRR